MNISEQLIRQDKHSKFLAVRLRRPPLLVKKLHQPSYR